MQMHYALRNAAVMSRLAGWHTVMFADVVVWLCSMCLFLQNQDFQIHAEYMLDTLYDGGKQAAARLLFVNASLSQQVLDAVALTG